MKNSESNTQGGFSIIELLIVLVVIGIIVTFAVAQFGASSASLERQNIAREFKVNLERARFDSVRRRATNCADMSRVEVTSPTSFRLISDQSQNGTVLKSDGTVDPADIRDVNFTNRSQVSIVGNALVFPIVYRFDQRGDVSTGPCPIDATVAVPTTTFCNSPCTFATATATNSNVVFVSDSGTATIMRGGTAVPTFDPPGVTNANVSEGIDNRLTVWTGTPPTPSPLPSVTVATPTPLPAVTPNPDPSATPTPTPSPTPVACSYGQKPNQDNCTCINPMKLQGSKCVGATPTPTP